MDKLEDIYRAANDLRTRLKTCSDVKEYNVEVVPDDYVIIIEAVMIDGTTKRRVFKKSKQGSVA